MSVYVKECVVDTNVILTANLKPTDETAYNYPEMVSKSIGFLIHLKDQKGVVVLDSGDEIFSEYKRHLNFSGQPGVGDMFFKWLHDNR